MQGGAGRGELQGEHWGRESRGGERGRGRGRVGMREGRAIQGREYDVRKAKCSASEPASRVSSRVTGRGRAEVCKGGVGWGRAGQKEVKSSGERQGGMGQILPAGV